MKSPAAVCWLCGAAQLAAGSPPATAVAAAPAEPRRPFQFGISSLLTVTTLLGIECSIAAMAPGLGIILIVLSVPALLHTAILSWRRANNGDPMSMDDKALYFFMAAITTFGVLLIAGFAAIIIMFLACAVGLQGSEDTYVNMAGCAAIAVVAFATYLYIRWLRRMGRKKGSDTKSLADAVQRPSEPEP